MLFLTYIMYVDLQSVDSTMSGVPPELLDIDWSNLFYSPMHPFCMPFPVADNSNYRDDEVPYRVCLAKNKTIQCSGLLVLKLIKVMM
jgi:hypothetical protein